MNERSAWKRWVSEGHTSIPTLLLSHYASLGITDQECMLLIHLHSSIEKGNHFPTPEEIAEKMTIDSSACFATIQRLIKRGFLAIHETTVSEVREESYSLFPLWEAILHRLEKEDKQQTFEQTMQNQTDLYSLFEQEFARPLSPLECETLAMWVDQDGQSPALIKAALKEAVISSKLNFRYIDRILFEWKKKGITTPESAKAESEQFRQPQRPARNEQEVKKVPFYNWLENK